MREKVLKTLNDFGFLGELVSSRRLPELKEEFDILHRRGLLGENIYKSYFSQFSYSPPPEMGQGTAIIITAVPQPISRVIFYYHKCAVPVLIPPTYIASADIAIVSGLLEETLHPEGYHLAKAQLPEKPVAVRSGLGVYGRNSICYLPNGGSFFRLAAFFSDLPCPEDNWQKMRLMEQCERCSICACKCPTGAIFDDDDNSGMMVNAERCLTYLNEGKADFPEWINRQWHNALVGCMVCQEVCPANKDYINNFVTVETFTEDETTLILEACPQELLPAETRRKLEQIEFADYFYSLLPRNLKALL